MTEEERTPLLSETRVSVNVSGSYSDDSTNEDRCCSVASFRDPTRAMHRFIVLFFMCFLGFGSYFCYDNPGALQSQIIEDMDITTSQFAALYAWYSWPNVVLCFFGGFLIDRVFGIRLGAIIFSLFILAGQFVFAVGALVNKFWVMEAGRFVFGIGGESLAVAQNTYAVSWFKGKELNMVFGLQLSFARVGSTVNFNVMQPIYKWIDKSYEGYECLGIVLFVASVSCLLSLICAFVLGFLDWRAEKILKKASVGTGETISLTDVKDFPLSFWLLTVICIAYYVAIFPFIGLGSVFFEKKFGFTSTGANAVDSIVYVISAIASPLFGILVDRTGRNLMWVLISVVVTLGAHMLLAFSFLNPWIAMVVMGNSYSLLACALWPMVALVVPEHQLGTAYGLMQSVQNLGLGVIAMVSGIIVDMKGYLFLETFYLAWLSVALITTIILFCVNSRTNGPLNLTVNERNRREERKMAAEFLEREKLAISGSTAEVTPQDLLRSQSDFHLRNRYLSRIGAKLPAHFDISTCALMHRTGPTT
ncbi:lysosomal dipeptide transporter MFSD1-like [Tachypleus tridentatus]|uniref:lysosomal dipeptide transporter MFSD1-like n=1 Tax=Tachypleus tridentatus TaxID=6853 RepID=UPI003FD16874